MSDVMEKEVGHAPAEGKITDEAIAQARSMIGLQLRPEGPYLQDATEDTIRNFCNGIGDLNPLYRDAEHGRQSRYGANVAHPMFPMAFGWIGRTRWGLPGVHGFYAGNDWELFRHIRPGDRITAIERVVGIEEKESKFSGRLVLQYVEATYSNQRGDVVARALGTCTRHERKAARDAGKYKDVKPYEYTADEFAALDEAILKEDERMRGTAVRYFEDVNVGDELPPIVRGPLSLMDTMGFLVGCGRGHTHGIVLKSAVKHPGHFFRNPEAGGGIEYTGIGHHRESVAKEVGVPGTYDYGPQRSSWLASLVTNWMGDAAFLKRVRTEMRRFNTMGDSTWCKGKVSRKYVKDGFALVDLEIWGENQRGELTTPGLATVMLPSRNVENRVFFDGGQLDLELPTIR
ncbi:MaoC family dehydratase N-terminal domain-containing protein [Bradyrhizobium sp. CCGB01]|uniref:FAS1-like dehydratase domain-containing protein n=1 Tax=Bradyrhizobium sp. CCGB01 TaxID=2949634 RepID=UPI0020B2A72A|nr:MaoC family dehydratase N-terminal domain-containing protein [Bradyrhizobium sp. CCGB01]MCP3409376.1 MaoC family dehydratase N-terminal domain-containing protein [Bradyrhizobium sp. CCGB01]